MTEIVAACKSCASARLMKLGSETIIHFPGLKGLKQPPIFVFPSLFVCLDCGTTESILSESELLKIRGATASFTNGSH
jgi:DNA-directed RNA polymerase subunit RPC12/RpoP